MPKYYCDYCDTFLTHDSPSVRKTHNGGRKHKENVRMFYQLWMEEQAQKLVDATTKAFTQQRMLNPNAVADAPTVMPGAPTMPRGVVASQMMRAPMPVPFMPMTPNMPPIAMPPRVCMPATVMPPNAAAIMPPRPPIRNGMLQK